MTPKLAAPPGRPPASCRVGADSTEDYSANYAFSCDAVSMIFFVADNVRFSQHLSFRSVGRDAPYIYSRWTMETTFVAWKKQLEKLVHRLNAHEKGLEASQWRIGDWLVQGEKDFDTKAYDAAETITGWSRGTLYNIVWVVG